MISHLQPRDQDDGLASSAEKNREISPNELIETGIFAE
jgi:hypothetical protein